MHPILHISRRCLPQILRIHLPLAASEKIDCGEAEDEHPDDMSPRFGPTPERAFERLRDVVRVDQVAQLARRCYLPEKNQSTLIIGRNPMVKRKRLLGDPQPCFGISVGSLLDDNDGGACILGEFPGAPLNENGNGHDSSEDKNDREHVDRRVGGHCEKRWSNCVSQGEAR